MNLLVPASVGDGMDDESALWSAAPPRISLLPQPPPLSASSRSPASPEDLEWVGVLQATETQPPAASRRQTHDLVARNGEKCMKLLLHVAGLSRRWMAEASRLPRTESRAPAQVEDGIGVASF
jgi:hypothetical protein